MNYLKRSMKQIKFVTILMKKLKIKERKDKVSIDKKIKQIDFFLKNSIEHRQKNIEYVLLNPKTQELYVLCADHDDAIEFTPYTKNYPNGYCHVPDFDYNFDYYLFNQLESGLNIKYISMNTHNGIWNSINELYPHDFECKAGLRKYINYCQKSNITKSKIDKETSSNVPNILNLFNKERKEER